MCPLWQTRLQSHDVFIPGPSSVAGRPDHDRHPRILDVLVARRPTEPPAGLDAHRSQDRYPFVRAFGSGVTCPLTVTCSTQFEI